MILHRFAFLAGLALVCTTAVACGARDGGVCQLNSDCASGLICCKNSPELTGRGVCRPTGTVEGMCATTTTPDSGTADVDAARVDGGSDAGDVDAGEEDASSDVDAGSDEDAASEEDAAVDDVDAADVDAGA